MQKQPNAIPAPERERAMKLLPADIVHKLAAFIHDGWWQEKLDQGFHHPADAHPEWDPANPRKICDRCHLDIVPYDELSPATQKYDLITAETCVAGLNRLHYVITSKNKTQPNDQRKQ